MTAASRPLAQGTTQNPPQGPVTRPLAPVNVYTTFQQASSQLLSSVVAVLPSEALRRLSGRRGVAPADLSASEDIFALNPRLANEDHVFGPLVSTQPDGKTLSSVIRSLLPPALRVEMQKNELPEVSAMISAKESLPKMSPIMAPMNLRKSTLQFTKREGSQYTLSMLVDTSECCTGRLYFHGIDKSLTTYKG